MAPVSLTFEEVKIKGSLPFHGSKKPLGPEEKHTYTEMKLVLPLDYQDWLLLEHSSEEGYMVVIQPVKQPLPLDDQGNTEWDIPGNGSPPTDPPEEPEGPET